MRRRPTRAVICLTFWYGCGFDVARRVAWRLDSMAAATTNDAAADKLGRHALDGSAARTGKANFTRGSFRMQLTVRPDPKRSGATVTMHSFGHLAPIDPARGVAVGTRKHDFQIGPGTRRRGVRRWQSIFHLSCTLPRSDVLKRAIEQERTELTELAVNQTTRSTIAVGKNAM